MINLHGIQRFFTGLEMADPAAFLLQVETDPARQVNLVLDQHYVGFVIDHKIHFRLQVMLL